jgi:hypothetical protein
MIFKYDKKANKYCHGMFNLYIVQWMFTGNILIKASCTKFTADLGEVP